MSHLKETLIANVTKKYKEEKILKCVAQHADLSAGVGQIENLEIIRDIFRPDSIEKCMKRLEELNCDFSNKLKVDL